MKNKLFVLAGIFVFLLPGCKNKSITGTYVCDASARKENKTIVEKDGSHSGVLDMTCVVSQLSFVTDKTVTLSMPNGSMTAEYDIDKDFVRVKGSDNAIILFKILDSHTLEGKDIFKGKYIKK